MPNKEANPVSNDTTAGRRGEPKVYSDAELDAIAAEVSRAASHPNHVYLDGRQVPKDWDEDAFISQEMYEDFLRCVQTKRICKATGKPYTSDATFEGYLQDSLDNLKFRRHELQEERGKGDIDQRTYLNALMVAELAEEAIKKYLEKNSVQRLIGV